MPNFLKKIYSKTFRSYFYKLCFIVGLFFVFSPISILLLTVPVFADVPASTSTASGVITADNIEKSSEPCDIYNMSWGTGNKRLQDLITAGSPGGLYTNYSDNVNDSEKNRVDYLYRQGLGKDPIFFTNNSTAEYKLPMLGVTDIKADPFSFTSGRVLLPCILGGSLKGLVARIVDDIKSVNPPSNNDGCRIANPTNICSSDISYINKFNTVGGCPVEMLFYGSTGLRLNVDYDGIADDKRKLITNAGAIIRTIYAPGTVLKKTDYQGSKYEYRRSVDAMKAYAARFYGDPKTGSIYKDNIKYNEDNSKIADYKIYYGTGSSEFITKNQFLLDQSKMASHVIGGWYDNGKSSNEPTELYFYDGSFASYLDKSSFICNSRIAPFTMANGTVRQIKVYEWLPSSLTQLSSPTCEIVGGANTQKVIVLPSAVQNAGGTESKKIVVCTPCVVPRLFQTDIFGQPVFGIPTGIGCLPSSLNGIITVLLRISVGVSGGLALMFIILSGIKIATNSGNPDEIKKAQKTITSAITGLLVIVFALLLLNVVGVKILDLGAFGGSELEFITTG